MMKLPAHTTESHHWAFPLLFLLIAVLVTGCGKKSPSGKWTEVPEIERLRSQVDTLTPKSILRRIGHQKTEMLTIGDRNGHTIQLVIPAGAFKDSVTISFAVDEERSELPIRNVQIPRIIIAADAGQPQRPLTIFLSSSENNRFAPLTRIYLLTPGDKLMPLPDQNVTDSTLTGSIYRFGGFFVGTITQSEFNSALDIPRTSNFPAGLDVQSNSMGYFEKVGSIISAAEAAQRLGMEDYAQELFDEAAKEVADQMDNLVEGQLPADPCSGFIPDGLRLLGLGQSLGTADGINSRLDNFLQDIVKDCPLSGSVEWKVILLLFGQEWEITPDQAVPIARIEGTRLVGHGRQKVDATKVFTVSDGEGGVGAMTISFGTDFVASLVGELQGYTLRLAPTVRYTGKSYVKVETGDPDRKVVLEAVSDPATQETKATLDVNSIPFFDFRVFQSNAPISLGFDLSFSYNDGSTYVYRIPFPDQELKGVILFTLRLASSN